MTDTQTTGPEKGRNPLPTTPEMLFARLNNLGIEIETVRHPPVYTVEEAKRLRGVLPGAHIKNLFLRDKKARMFLVTCLEDRRIDLKALSDALKAKRFSFASAGRLMTYLGVEPGSVTPFAAINDNTGAVQVVLDHALRASGPINAHPLVNDMTTAIAPGDLLKFLEATGHPPQFLDFDSL